MKKRALSLVLCMTMAITMIPCFTISAFAATEEKASVGETTNVDAQLAIAKSREFSNKITNQIFAAEMVQAETKKEGSNEPILAYVPLDNRPVNVDRVIYEAESAGFTVMMPEEDLYATRLDGQPVNSNNTQFGDSQKLLDWILEMDEKTDYFVISLDQLLSGGLVNSRTLYDTTYYDEYKIIDDIIKLSQNNHVYIIDTVTRLASCTVGYQGATLETYNYLRQYNLNARPSIEDKNLSVNNIFWDYSKDANGDKITIDSKYSSEVKNSLRTRERKLRLIDYLMTMDYSKSIKYFIGIDDSNPQNTIQTNEVKFIKNKMGDRGLIYSGADELGMMAVLGLMIDYYGYNVNAATVYFGDTEGSGSGSVYDMETVKENIQKHLESIGVNLVEKDKADLEIVVLTSPNQAVLNSKYISRMIDYINNNIKKSIPTIVINSAPSIYSGNLEYRMIRESEMSMLLSYSSWGTVGNSIGLALGDGISRYLYLHSRTDSSNTADIAFLKGLIFSYEKDISYIRGGGKDLFNTYLSSSGWSTSNFYQDEGQVKIVNKKLENILKTSDYNVSVDDIIDNLTDCRYLKGLGGECGIIGSINLSNYSAPFFRTYEIRFDINVKLRDTTLNGFDKSMTINMPYTPKEGQLTYSFDLYYLDEWGKLLKVPCTYDKSTGNAKFDTDKLPNFYTATLSMEKEKAQSLFTDVSESSWYFDYVMYAYEKGLMKGTTSNTFEPKAPMTRAMLVYTLYSMAGAPEVKGECTMPNDVGNSWYKPAVEWALANGIVSGYGNGTFGPKDSVTREQLANILWRYAKYKGMDVSKGEHGAESNGPDWAYNTGIITGTGNGNALSLNALATRAEVAAVLKRFAEQDED